MFARQLQLPRERSFLLVGPRGTGKTQMVGRAMPGVIRIELDDPRIYAALVERPETLEALTGPSLEVIVDGLQRLPRVLGTIDRMIDRGVRVALISSSTRKLELGERIGPVLHLHPLTAAELGASFDLRRSIETGHLPEAHQADDPSSFWRGYVGAFLNDDIRAEGLTRNLEGFSRLLRAASHYQARVLSISALARDASISRKTIEGHIALLVELGMAVLLPVLPRRTKRPLTTHPKFFYFDVGLHRALCAKGELAFVGELDEPALETLVFQELRATNENLGLGYSLFYWHTRDHIEVDFVLEGARGLLAFEVRASERLDERALGSLRAFQVDHPDARCHLLYGGERHLQIGNIEIWPIRDALHALPAILGV